MGFHLTLKKKVLSPVEPLGDKNAMGTSYLNSDLMKKIYMHQYQQAQCLKTYGSTYETNLMKSCKRYGFVSRPTPPSILEIEYLNIENLMTQYFQYSQTLLGSFDPLPLRSLTNYICKTSLISWFIQLLYDILLQGSKINQRPPGPWPLVASDLALVPLYFKTLFCNGLRCPFALALK